MQCFASVRHWAIRLSVIAWAAALGGCFQPTFVSRKVSAISKSFGFSGKVQAGPLQVGEVSVYSLTDSGTRGELLGSSTTDLDGNFNVNISKDFGGRPVMVVASGGVFEEEASAAPVNLGAGELVALVDAAGGTVAVTPLSHLAYRGFASAQLAAAGMSDAELQEAILDAGGAIATQFGLTARELITTLPSDPASMTSGQGESPKKYARALAALSLEAVNEGKNSIEFVAQPGSLPDLAGVQAWMAMIASADDGDRSLKDILDDALAGSSVAFGGGVPPSLLLPEDFGEHTLLLSSFTGPEWASFRIEASSSNPDVVSHPSVVLSPDGRGATLSFTSVKDAVGSAVVTVVLQGVARTGNSASVTIPVTVSAINDNPTLNAIPDLELPFNTGATINLSGITSGAQNEAAQVLSVTAAPSDPSLFASVSVSYESPQSAGSIAVLPNLGAVAEEPTLIQVTVTDSEGASFVRNFSVRIRGDESASSETTTTTTTTTTTEQSGGEGASEETTTTTTTEQSGGGGETGGPSYSLVTSLGTGALVRGQWQVVTGQCTGSTVQLACGGTTASAPCSEQLTYEASLDFAACGDGPQVLSVGDGILSASLSITVDSVPPPAATSMTLELDGSVSRGMRLDWVASAEPGVRQLAEIFSGGGCSGEVVQPQDSVSPPLILSAASAGVYSYRIATFDPAGNRSDSTCSAPVEVVDSSSEGNGGGGTVEQLQPVVQFPAGVSSFVKADGTVLFSAGSVSITSIVLTEQSALGQEWHSNHDLLEFSIISGSSVSTSDYGSYYPFTIGYWNGDPAAFEIRVGVVVSSMASSGYSVPHSEFTIRGCGYLATSDNQLQGEGCYESYDAYKVWECGTRSETWNVGSQQCDPPPTPTTLVPSVSLQGSMLGAYSESGTLFVQAVGSQQIPLSLGSATGSDHHLFSFSEHPDDHWGLSIGWDAMLGSYSTIAQTGGPGLEHGQQIRILASIKEEYQGNYAIYPGYSELTVRVCGYIAVQPNGQAQPYGVCFESESAANLAAGEYGCGMSQGTWDPNSQTCSYY